MIAILKLKKYRIEILFLIFLFLIFLLWGRILFAEFTKNDSAEKMYTAKDRVSRIKEYGWDVLQMSEKEQETDIPQEFDRIWEDYNRLQKASGFNLEKYKGKRVKKYTYSVLNFPVKTQEEILINILVADGILIGGDCMSPKISGFIIPLDKRYAP